MPYVKMEMFKGRTHEQKRKLVADMTRAICENIDCSPDDVWITIDEKDKENWGSGGQLVSEKTSKVVLSMGDPE